MPDACNTIKVEAVERNGQTCVTLLHTVVDLKYKAGGTTMLESIPVECLRVVRKKRVRGIRVIVFLLSLFAGPLLGVLLCFLMARMFQDGHPNVVIPSTIGAALIPSLFLFFRMLRRDPVIEFSTEAGGSQRFQFWLPLKQSRREEAEALLVAIEAVRPNTVSMNDQPILERDPIKSPSLIWIDSLAQLMLFFCLPALIAKKVWLFLLVLIPLVWALVVGVRWLCNPVLLRDASRATRRGQWEEALRCLTSFEEQDATRKGCCLLDRLYCMRRLGRFDDAFALLNAQRTLIDAAVYQDLREQLAMTQRVTQRKNGFIGGRWFPGAMKGNT